MIRNERGSLAVTMIMAVIAIIGIIGIFSMLRSSIVSLGYATDKGRTGPAVEFILSRIEACVAIAAPAFCPKADEFRTMMTLPVGTLTPTTTLPVAPITLSQSDIEGQAGMITSRLGSINETLASYSAIIERQPTVDDTLFASTRVSISFTYVPKFRFIALANEVVTKSLRVTVQSPISFGLVLRNGVVPAVSLPNSSGLNVIGGALLWKSAAAGLRPSEVISAAQSSGLTIDRTWTTSPKMSLDDSNDETSFSVFTAGGVATNSFPAAADPFSGNPSWEQPLDYRYVYDSNGYPLPSAVANSAHSSVGDRRVDWDKDTASVQVRSSATSFPSPNVMGANGLEITCERPENFQEGSMKALVLLRQSQDLMFDYTANGGANFACGLVIGKVVTFIVPAGQTVTWFGHVNAERIVVDGGGTLAILNPFSASSRPSDLPGPTNLTVSEMMTMYMALGSSTAHNFFVPFARNLSTFTGQSGYNMMQDYFTTMGAYRTWTLTVDPPDLTEFLKGTGCVRGGTPSCWDESVYLFTEETF